MKPLSASDADKTFALMVWVLTCYIVVFIAYAWVLGPIVHPLIVGASAALLALVASVYAFAEAMDIYG